jgi:hypothetical protein
MYCTSEGCSSFCEINEECSLGEVCCQQENFGICKPKKDCNKLYEPSLEFENPDIDINIKYPLTEKPRRINQPWFYIALIIVVLFFGYIYLINIKKKSK